MNIAILGGSSEIARDLVLKLGNKYWYYTNIIAADWIVIATCSKNETKTI